MILYFSGTGNSEYLANKLAKALDDELVNLFDYIKNEKSAKFYSEKPFVLVSPTYAWRLPRFLVDFLKKTTFTGNKDIYVIMNFGDSCGNADKHARQDMEESGLSYKGLYGIKMPENYLMLFELDSKEHNDRTIEKASGQISKIANTIGENKDFDSPDSGLLGKIQSSFINNIFYKFIVKDKKFYYTDKCIQCGLCAKVCVLNNITYENHFPKWNGNCTHCSACISKCPTGAIEYGKKTIGKDRYLLEKQINSDISK